MAVRRKETGLIYAMKVIEKARIIRTKKIPQAFQELSIMSRLDSPFLVKIYYAFQSVRRSLTASLIICTSLWTSVRAASSSTT